RSDFSRASPGSRTAVLGPTEVGPTHLSGVIDNAGPLSGRSRKVAIDLRQQLGEIQAVRAGGPGGSEVGALPISGRLGQLGEEAAGLAPGPVPLVVGQVAGQVAQQGLGPAGP